METRDLGILYLEQILTLVHRRSLSYMLSIFLLPTLGFPAIKNRHVRKENWPLILIACNDPKSSHVRILPCLFLFKTVVRCLFPTILKLKQTKTSMIIAKVY